MEKLILYQKSNVPMPIKDIFEFAKKKISVVSRMLTLIFTYFGTYIGRSTGIGLSTGTATGMGLKKLKISYQCQWKPLVISKIQIILNDGISLKNL